MCDLFKAVVAARAVNSLLYLSLLLIPRLITGSDLDYSDGSDLDMDLDTCHTITQVLFSLIPSDLSM